MLGFDAGGIFNNVVASALWLALGLLLGGTADYVRRRRSLRLVWDLARTQKDLSVAISTLQSQDTGQYARPMTGLGALVASASVSQSLADAYPRNRPRLHLHFSDGFPAGLLRNPLVAVGGPRFNDVSRQQMSSPGLRYIYDLGERAVIRDTVSGAVYSSSMHQNGVEKDYALITRTRNPYNRETFVLSLSGIHTFGVAAAALMLTKPHVRDVARRVRGLGPEWQVLLEVPVVGQETFPRVLDAAKVSSAQ
jgi:hypothetical protein